MIWGDDFKSCRGDLLVLSHYHTVGSFSLDDSVRVSCSYGFVENSCHFGVQEYNGRDYAKKLCFHDDKEEYVQNDDEESHFHDFVENLFRHTQRKVNLYHQVQATGTC